MLKFLILSLLSVSKNFQDSDLIIGRSLKKYTKKEMYFKNIKVEIRELVNYCINQVTKLKSSNVLYTIGTAENHDMMKYFFS